MTPADPGEPNEKLLRSKRMKPRSGVRLHRIPKCISQSAYVAFEGANVGSESRLNVSDEIPCQVSCEVPVPQILVTS